MPNKIQNVQECDARATIYIEGQSKEWSEENVQKAKDFLWKYINADNKGLAIHNVITDSLERNGLEVEEVIIGYKFK